MPARPQAPPLVTMPSTPGPEVPGGYPRNSAVFTTNQWADSNVGATAPSTFLATAKTYLPAGVASYFPDVPPKHPTPSVTPSPGVHTPYPRDVPPVLNTDGTVTSVSFSTRAYAGSRSSRQGEPGSPGAESNFTYVRTPGEEVPVPMQMPEEEEVPPPPEHAGDATEAEAAAVPRPRATSGLKPSHPGVADSSHPPLTHTESHLPLLADVVSAPAAPSPATSAGTTPSTAPSSPPLATPPPSSPASLSPSPKSPKLLSRFKSLRRPVDKAAAAGPPSAFHARGGSVDVGRSVEAVNMTRGGGASLDSASPSPASPASPSPSPASSNSRKKSLLRTLRGEAKVLTGKVRRDAGKVEEGRRLLNEV